MSNNSKNLLEKITCIIDGNKTNINHLGCYSDMNYKKLLAFIELIKVYTFSIDKVIRLINVNKVYRLCDLVYRLQNNDKTLDYIKNGYENLGLLYYTNQKSVNEKYYKILEILKLDKKLDPYDNSLPLKKRLYNYTNSNTKTVKDLNSIIVLFDYYEIFDRMLLEYNEDDYEWDYSILRSIDLNADYWYNNSYFKEYNIKKLIIDTINEFTKEDKNIFNHELNKKFKLNQSQNKQENQEYKTMDENEADSSSETKQEELIEKLSLKYIKTNFSSVFTSIIEDFIDLYQNRCRTNCGESNKPTIIFLYYFNGVIKIVTKKGRMFYIGLFLLGLSFMLYFIRISG